MAVIHVEFIIMYPVSWVIFLNRMKIVLIGLSLDVVRLSLCLFSSLICQRMQIFCFLSVRTMECMLYAGFNTFAN